MKPLKNQPLAEFLDNLAAKAPVPGGGSAAALAGALAASLVVMVVKLTVGKEKYRKQEDEMLGIGKRSERLRRELLDLVDQDAKAYESVVKTKGSPSAVKKAAEVPLRTAEKSLLVLEIAALVTKIGNQNCRSDAVTAGELARAAVAGGLENVRINLPFLKDENLRRKLSAQVKNCAERAALARLKK